MKKIKLMILVDIFFASAGGAERQILELTRHLDRKRFTLIVGCLSGKGTLLNELKKKGIRTVNFKVKRIYDINGLMRGWQLRSLLKDEKVDILMTYHFGSDIWGTIFGKLAGVPVIISNRRDSGFWRNKKHILAYRIINRWVDRIIVVAQAVKNVVVHDENVAMEKIKVIHNCVDLKRFMGKTNIDLRRKQCRVPKEAFVIGCVGNLKPVKGHQYLIASAAELIKKIPQTHLIFIGWDEGKIEKSLLVQAQELGVSENIHFLGLRKDIPKLLSICDVCVLPSLSEGLSNALLEYMAAGRPVVATAVGGNPELVLDGFTGILVKKENKNELTEAILQLWNDPLQRKAMGRHGRERIRQYFSIPTMIHNYTNIFEQACS